LLKKAVIIYSAIILLLAVLPINGPDSVLNDNYFFEIRLDYLAHFVIYIPWVVLIWLYTGASYTRTPARAFGWLTAGIALAIFSELIQYFLPYRAFNINDLIANVIGVAMGSVIFFFKRPLREL
jgi:VanZ family protein